ncbi:hypothetical protein DPMN_063838 [Dreissena polymorpha]|uniref:Uncharacterized protein n=1 Tax=Dreissena polymorpha TaxID=45954 RepID=A0A9D4CB98_DREPO|nr:hypothetical protein DPMN_063838 [Dreissena polymorpha]
MLRYHYFFVNWKIYNAETAICCCYGQPRSSPATPKHTPLSQRPTKVKKSSQRHVISGEEHGCILGDGANLASMITSWLSSDVKILEHLRNSSAYRLKCTIQFWEGSSSPREATHSVQGALGSRAKVSCHTTSPGFWCKVLRHAVFLACR